MRDKTPRNYSEKIPKNSFERVIKSIRNFYKNFHKSMKTF